MKRLLSCLVVVVVFASSAASAADLKRPEDLSRATRHGLPSDIDRDGDVLQFFLPSSEPAMTLEVSEEHEGATYRSIFVDRAGTDMRTGSRQTLSTIRIYSPDGGIVFAQSTLLSNDYNAAPTAVELAAADTTGSRFSVGANASTSDIIRQLRSYIRLRQFLTAARFATMLAKNMMDKVLAPLVKSALEAEGQYCPPKPRWWIAPTYLWYLLGCRGIAY